MRTRSSVALAVIVALLAMALAAGFASADKKTTEGAKAKGVAAKTDVAQGDVKWELTGSRIIGCCCATPCPCRMNYKPMHGHGCDFTTAVHIEKGRIGDTKMDGMTWIYTGRGFGEDVKGNWGYLYVTDKASEGQLTALNGFMEAGTKALGTKLPYIVGEFKGVRTVPMSYAISADKLEHSARIPEILEIKARGIVLPGHKEPARTTGIFDDFGDSFTHADCLVHTLNDPQTGSSWDLTGRQINFTDFTVSEATVAKGGIGWGCWSAHADLGSKTKYEEKYVGHDIW